LVVAVWTILIDCVQLPVAIALHAAGRMLCATLKQGPNTKYFCRDGKFMAPSISRLQLFVDSAAAAAAPRHDKLLPMFVLFLFALDET
jgi:hypothetical protein